MVEQSEYGTNTPYLTDFIQICLCAKLVNLNEIRSLYLEKGLSSAQIANRLRISKTAVLTRLRSMGIHDEAKPKRYKSPDNFRCPVPPFGYSIVDGKLVVNKAELRICHAVVEMMGRRGLSATETAKELLRRGFKNRKGLVSWNHPSVLSIYRKWKDKI